MREGRGRRERGVVKEKEGEKERQENVKEEMICEDKIDGVELLLHGKRGKAGR